MDRRSFLQRGALAAAALAIPERLLADPYAPLFRPPIRSSAVRVSGRVRAGSRGVGGVAVTDGLSVVATDASGRFTLIADSSRPFVSISVPSGYALPTTPTGTTLFYKRLAPDGRGEMSTEFTLQPLEGSDDDHAFLLLADTQTQNAFEMGRLHAETVPDVRATIAGLAGMSCFGVACGDIMFDDLSLYPEYERAVRGMGAPFFQVVGNHDLNFDTGGDGQSTRTFESRFGPPYYSFDRGQVHYVVLDDVMWYGSGYIGYVDDPQLRWLEADLSRIEPGRTVVVLLHIPVLSTRSQRDTGSDSDIAESMTNRQALYRLLEKYRAYAISGHTHEHERHGDGAIMHHTSGTVCGAWWSGDICWDGTPNGYTVYEVRGRELRWRYKSTGKSADHQMRLYPPGSDPTAPGDMIANVWDADGRWTVSWFENGERRGRMSRRLGHDPLSVEQHTGPEKPPRRTWVEPTRTDHLFYAPVSPSAREVRVEATNAWGQTYTASLSIASRR
jgi:3',5'-cyclic AMP phosphodiesterase CpdA